MEIKVFTFNPFQENTVVVYNAEKDAVIVDPGCLSREEQDTLSDFISSRELKVHAILNTHCHLDHIMGNHFCVSKYNVDLLAHKEEMFTLSMAERSAEMYGIQGFISSPEPHRFIEDNEELTFGKLTFKVIFAPGHSVGHVAFYNAENNLLIGGDILFRGSFGRVDLPGGSMEVLKESIFSRMFTLPDDTVVVPGHGPATTIGEEKRSNYILQF